MGESTRLILDLLEIANKFKINGNLVTVDTQKAFDSLDLNFIIAVLESFGFKSNFIEQINIFVNEQKTCIINGGVTTQYFKLKRAARQGKPYTNIYFYFMVRNSVYFDKKQRKY